MYSNGMSVNDIAKHLNVPNRRVDNALQVGGLVILESQSQGDKAKSAVHTWDINAYVDSLNPGDQIPVFVREWNDDEYKVVKTTAIVTHIYPYLVDTTKGAFKKSEVYLWGKGWRLL